MGAMAKRFGGDKKAVPGGARQCVLCPPLASLLLPTASSRVRRICASNCFRVSKCSAMAKRQAQNRHDTPPHNGDLRHHPFARFSWLLWLVGPRASTAVPAAGLGGRKRRRSRRDERVGRSSTRARLWARFDRPGRPVRAIERDWRTFIALRARRSLLVVAYLGARVRPTARRAGRG